MMSQESVKKKGWVLFAIWVLYIALLSLYGEFVISRPVNGWVQYAASILILVFSFYLFKITLSPLISYKKHKNDNN
jgi:membrane protein YdbS with pleckstrin-like domain